MSAEILAYDANDESRTLTCPHCWAGPARDGLVDYYDELFDVSCPECQTMLLIVSTVAT